MDCSYVLIEGLGTEMREEKWRNGRHVGQTSRTASQGRKGLDLLVVGVVRADKFIQSVGAIVACTSEVLGDTSGEFGGYFNWPA